MCRSKEHLRGILFCHEKINRQVLLEIFLNSEILVCSMCLNPPVKNQFPLFPLSPLFQTPGQDQQTDKHCHLLPRSFRIFRKDTSSNISMNPLGFHLSINFIKFSRKPVYPTMVVKNIQIYGVQISGKWICKSKN